MLAHARPDKLERTLQSLLAVRQVDRSQVFVVQDGKDRAVEALVRELGLKHVRARPAPSADNGAAKVAAAYKWALSHAFDFLTRDEALIVVEDDLLFAPDLMEFSHGYHVRATPPSGAFRVRQRLPGSCAS